MQNNRRFKAHAGFSKKMQDIFDVLVDDIKRLGYNKFDFFTEAKALEKYLADAGIKMQAPKYIAELFDELELSKSSWKPDKKDLVAFFKTLPDRIKKEKVT